MPELPEVENVARILAPLIQGRQILSCALFRAKNVLNQADEFLKAIQGKTFKSVSRRGKYLIFSFEDGGYLLSHLRMEGRYIVEKEGLPFRKHDILSYSLSGGVRLVYNDTRKFGRIVYLGNEGELEKALSRLGKEPFALSNEEFFSLLQGCRKPIKEAIMDQSLIAGVGNIYADESLFSSKIHPLTEARSLSKEEASSLLSSIQAILGEAIGRGGSTVRTYHPQEGVSGTMQDSLLAYGKKGQACPRCGARFATITVNGRGTTYCPLCQRKKGRPFVLGILGPIHCGKSTAASFLVKRGFLLFDADKEAKALYSLRSVQKKVASLFPGALQEDGQVDFAFLREALSLDPSKKEALGRILFPLVKKRAASFIAKAPRDSKIALDVPLLFKAEMGDLCEATLLILSSPSSQKERLLKEGRDAERLLSINADYPLEEAERKASLTLHNDGPKEEFEAKLAKLLQ